MNDEIEASTYKTWFQKYSSERALLLKDIDTLKKNGNDKWQRLEKLLPELINIQNVYERLKPITAKIHMVKTVFKHNIVYSEGGFRTPSMSEAFEDKCLNANKKGLLFLEQPLVFSGEIPFCSP
ncbi:MAG: hypothetical protein ABIN91_10385 [Mucilaginibacter sp.]|uniref:hypothetical protein n=1 Tax=Mucilaginibacter sp. TaxID=1882438 RepID=UPI003266D968